MEELLAAAAEAMNIPISMIERSAAARAKAEGVSIEDVLRSWAEGGEIVAAAASAPPARAPAESSAEVAEVAAPPPAASPLDDTAIIAAAAAKMGLPESMVTRSAAARAKAQGIEAETVLKEWAGIDAGAPAPTAVASDPAPAAASLPPAATPVPVPPAAPSAPEIEVEVLGTGGDVAPVKASVVLAIESEEEAVAAGALPRWLAALFVLVPAFALGYALFLPNGPNCGDAGSLAIDPVTGLAVNCDGSEFGAESVDLFALGSETYAGVGCVACHGPNGGGVASFPAFVGGELLATFPPDSCSAQLEWISLGTTGWPEPTYGATAKPVGGSGAVMPSFAATLSPQEIASVAIYERVAFGGQSLDDALADCGAPAGGATAVAE